MSFEYQLLAVRHGITQWNADHRWQGWADIPLSAVGMRQVTVAAKSLAALLRAEQRVIRIVSSDLTRAYQTAEAFAEALHIADIEIDAGLRERSVGAWSGKTTKEIEHQWPGMLTEWREGRLRELPDGEDEDGFQARIGLSLRRLTQEAADKDQLVVMATHGGVIRTLERIVGVEPAPVANVSGRWFHGTFDDVLGGPQVDLLSDELLAASGHQASEATGERTAGTVL
jgi:broad specificity phosphatase PhoE